MTRALLHQLTRRPSSRFQSWHTAAVVAGALALPSGLAAQEPPPTPPVPTPPVQTPPVQVPPAQTPPAQALPVPPDSAQQAPAPGDTLPQTHVVRPGDTLWEIARIYLGDPFLWPEIYRVNTAVIEDPHWIFPGQTLAIPAGFGAPVLVAEIPVTEEPAQPEQPVLPLGGQQTPVTVMYTPTEPSGPTVFGRRPERQRATPNLRALQEQPRTAVRPGEFRAAPWVDRDGGPRGTGRVVSTSQIPGVAAASERNRFHYQERLYVLPPEGVVPQRGERYLTFRLGPELNGLGQVAVPTGVVVIEEAFTGNRVASVARIVQQFDEIKQHDRLIALESLDLQPGVHPASTETGISGRVVWIQDEPVLPSLQRYLVVDASSRDGIKLGDQLTLLRAERVNEAGVVLPEQEIAVAQVVRVTPYGATAIVLDQTQPAIRPGTLVRVTARMP